jgi:hypothetical protein
MGYPITGAPPSTSLKPGDIDTLAGLNALVSDATLIDGGGCFCALVRGFSGNKLAF